MSTISAKSLHKNCTIIHTIIAQSLHNNLQNNLHNHCTIIAQLLHNQLHNHLHNHQYNPCTIIHTIIAQSLSNQLHNHSHNHCTIIAQLLHNNPHNHLHNISFLTSDQIQKGNLTNLGNDFGLGWSLDNSVARCTCWNRPLATWEFLTTYNLATPCSFAIFLAILL